jgi:carboxyl-terminal processing protease
MGRTTFGKGSVQTVIPLTAQTALKLTTSLYYTPSGASINHKGIVPDIELPRDDKARAETELAPRDDADVRRALQELKSPTVSHGNAVTAALPPRR